MATTWIVKQNNEMANLIFDMIRSQSLDVKLRVQRLLSKDINKQLAKQAVIQEEIKPYTMDELCGILEHDDGLSYDALREECLKEKYQL